MTTTESPIGALPDAESKKPQHKRTKDENTIIDKDQPPQKMAKIHEDLIQVCVLECLYYLSLIASRPPQIRWKTPRCPSKAFVCLFKCSILRSESDSSHNVSPVVCYLRPIFINYIYIHVIVPTPLIDQWFNPRIANPFVCRSVANVRVKQYPQTVDHCFRRPFCNHLELNDALA
jgi:hypothetical protein